MAMLNFKFYDFGSAIRKYREDLGITIREVCDGVGIKPATLLRIEDNKFIPDGKVLFSLFHFYNLTLCHYDKVIYNPSLYVSSSVSDKK